MSVNYSFFDDQLIGVDELNKITSRVFADGVVREVSSVSDLNGFVTDIATAGVVPQSCDSLKVTVNNDIITINKGTAIFSDGTVIEITEPVSAFSNCTFNIKTLFNKLVYSFCHKGCFCFNIKRIVFFNCSITNNPRKFRYRTTGGFYWNITNFSFNFRCKRWHYLLPSFSISL